MLKSRKTLIGIAIVIVLGVVTALGVAAWSVKTTLAAYVNQISPTQTPNVQVVPNNPTPNNQTPSNLSQYENQFLQAFATQLGTTVDKVKSAFVNAATQVIDQAVKDGKITQSQADQMKQRLSNQNIPGPFFFFGKGGGGMNGRMGFRFGVSTSEFASALGMNNQDLVTELRSGKSIADVAKEKNIDINQVTQKVLANAKTKLDDAVKNQQITQTQADQMYQKLSSTINQLVQQPGLKGGFGGRGNGHKFQTPTPSAVPSNGL